MDIQRVKVAAMALTVLASVTGPGAAEAEQPAAPQATTAVRSSADAFTSSAQPAANFGRDARLVVGWREPYGAARTLLRFDVESLDQKEAVTGATLRLFVREAGPSGDAGRDIPVQRVSAEWSESSVTWASFPGFDEDRWSTVNVGAASGWREWTGLRDLVRRWRLPEWQPAWFANRGVFVQGYEASGSFRVFDSREGSNKPELVLAHVTDRWPPVSTMLPLPPYVHAGSPGARPPERAILKLEWQASDPDPWTGIDFFRVYAQRNDGPFVLVFDQVEGFAKDFEARNGGVYRFSVQAVDQAGNLELAKSPEAQTHVDLTPPTALVQPPGPFVRGPFALSWQGSDGPTGADMIASGLVAYNVYFRINGGEWRPTALGVTGTTKLFDDPLVENAVYEFMAGAYDAAGNLFAPAEPQARTQLDRVAPTVVFEPISGIGRQSFPVRWRGEDFGGSGVASYDVQVRVNRQPWTDWVRDAAETERLFSGSFSNTYSFRARARDRAGNQGDYPQREQLVVGVIDPGIWVSRAWMPMVYTGR